MTPLEIFSAFYDIELSFDELVREGAMTIETRNTYLEPVRNRIMNELREKAPKIVLDNDMKRTVLSTLSTVMMHETELRN